MSTATGTKVRGRVRTQWLALGAALVVLAGVLVAWALSRAADRIPVVAVRNPVPAGSVITAGDLMVVEVAFDGTVTGLVPDSSLDRLEGRIAALDLAPGALLQVGMWRDAPVLAAGERSVGAVLAAGHYPGGLGQGATALAAPVDSGLTSLTGAAEDAGSGAPVGVPVRVLTAVHGDDGTLTVTLAVPAADALEVAQLAALDALVLVGVDAEGGA